MPRTIDSIKSAHKAAAERRAAGKPVWERRVSVELPNDGDSLAEIEENREAWAESLQASIWFKTGGEDVVSAVEELVNHKVETDADVYECNLLIDRVYDLADRDRVWINVTYV